jgi:hypothetical protein
MKVIAVANADQVNRVAALALKRDVLDDHQAVLHGVPRPRPLFAEPSQGFKFTVCVLNKNEPTPTRIILTISQVDVPI